MLIIDIETVAIPPTEEELIAIEASIKPPANYKKQDSIDKWMEEQAPLVLAEKISKRALDPFTNQIVAISAKYHGVGSDLVPQFNTVGTNEADLLNSLISQIVNLESAKFSPYPFAGVGIFTFDLPIIALHIAKHGVDPLNINFMPSKYDRKKVLDVMTLFDGKFRSVDTLAKFFNIDTSHNPITGADVQKYWEEGNLDIIGEHCASDVKIEYQIIDKIHKLHV